MVFADVPLASETDGEERHDRGVDANAEIATIVDNHGGVDIIEADLGVHSVGEVEWERGKEAEEVDKSHPFVSAADGEELMGKTTPCYSLGEEC